MFDLTRPITLDNLEQWINIVRKSDPNLPVIFLGTKNDLTEEIMINDDYAESVKEQFNLFEFLRMYKKHLNY